MGLSALIVFAALIFVTMGMIKQSLFVHYRPLKGMNMTSGILAAVPIQNLLHCASFCAELINCESFIYNPESKECQLHNRVFTSTRTSNHQPGLRNHYMRKGINDWCPLNDGYQLLARYGPCVKFHFELMTWHQANKSCSAYSPNSHLVVLDTKEKNDLVKAAGRTINYKFAKSVAIGLYEREDNVYSWVDGRDVIFTDWTERHDNSKTGRQDCVWFIRYDSWRWGRGKCEAGSRQRICEITLR